MSEAQQIINTENFGNMGLKGLSEIVLKEVDLSLIPKGPGVYVLVALVLAMILYKLFKRYRFKREYKQFIKSYNNIDKATQITDLLVLLKQLYKKKYEATNFNLVEVSNKKVNFSVCEQQEVLLAVYNNANVSDKLRKKLIKWIGSEL